MALQPGSGAAGQVIATAVLGFPAADGLTLHWNSPTGPLLATIRTDGSGSAETSFKVPAVAPGAYTVEAVDPHGTRTVGFVVTVAATKPPTTTGMLTPSSTTPGGLIRLATNGFRPSEMVYVLIGGRVIDVTQADPSGGIDVPIVVPAGPAGQVPIQVIGVQTGPHGTQNLTVNRRLVLHPASGPASSVVTGSAFGFPSASTVRMRWNSPTGTVLATVQADTFGSVSGPLTIPSTAGPGPQAVYAIQSRGVRAVAGFRVT
jgi:hypothetical protein